MKSFFIGCGWLSTFLMYFMVVLVNIIQFEKELYKNSARVPSRVVLCFFIALFMRTGERSISFEIKRRNKVELMGVFRRLKIASFLLIYSRDMQIDEAKVWEERLCICFKKNAKQTQRRVRV